MPSPREIYLQEVANGQIEKDPQQLVALATLDRVYQQLIVRQRMRHSTLGKARRTIKPRAPIKGLYMWGSVGIGKTHLMDIFYKAIPVKKMRMHFHGFMRELHSQLKQVQGIKDPLKSIAKKLADEHLVVCFDEFFVSNITDAMLLGELFQYLFSGGLCLIATSNIAPDELYKDGLQRERFLPTIHAINQFTTVLHLSISHDYRLRHLHKAGIYYTPLNKKTDSNLAICFDHFANNHAVSIEPIELYGRHITIVKQASKVIWFEFSALCAPPRSQNDYLALCEHYHTIIISNVPAIDKIDTISAVLFINLIDVLYDAHARVIVSAATDIEGIYPEGRLAFEFQRTKSRLIEMNSPEYFSFKN